MIFFLIEITCHAAWNADHGHFVLASTSCGNDPDESTSFSCMSYAFNGNEVKASVSNSTCPSSNTHDSKTFVVTGTLEGTVPFLDRKIVGVVT